MCAVMLLDVCQGIRNVTDTLKAQGIYDDTLIIFTTGMLILRDAADC